MEFGIWSNGFRPHTSPAQTYEEDLFEIVLADKLGFRDAYISEHHGEAVYLDKVDTLPVPELLMCKAAALTKNIRMGAAIKIAHLQHPVDVAIQAAVTEHLLGKGRFIFGFGSGVPTAVFCEERGLSFEDRHERLAESLELIMKCWTSKEPFDWNGKHWQGKGIVATPRPASEPHMPMATATDSDGMIKFCGENGHTLLSAFLEPAARLRVKSEKYCAAAAAVGRKNPRRNISVSKYIYLADSLEEAIDDLRPAANYELSFQAARGLLHFARTVYKLPIVGDTITIEDMVNGGCYTLGTPDQVTEQIIKHYEESGGFGTLLLIAGKSWATREKRTRSMTLFMDKVAPRLRGLDPVS
jgi:alkanesulfonate monooxygenase SsuD/methylene tetrahydromethanopterin reductase-like flavin-dependent oxidoreductase (luciferase family)